MLCLFKILLWWLPRSCSIHQLRTRLRWIRLIFQKLYCMIMYISIKRNHLYCERGFLSMSPAPNYNPQGTKLSEIEGKKHLKSLFIVLSVWTWLIRYNAGLQFRPCLVDAVGNRLRVKLSSVRLLMRNRSVWMWRLDVWRLNSALPVHLQ